jgi:hypothetical protein
MTRREAIITLGSVVVATRAWASTSAQSAAVDKQNAQTLKGEMVCAKCYLNKPDAKECQDVLLVKDAKGATAEFYVTKNKVAQDAGEACTNAVPATIIGSVSEKDGRKWITATKITKH